MAFVTKETKEKINTLVKEVRGYADVVDQSGLHMDTEVTALQAKADNVEAGLFNTLVMGKFKNGKSTFINSLVGKDMMASKASACTAVIATVEFGHNTNQVNVVYTDGKVVTKTLEQFTEEFQLTQEDQDLVEEGGRLDRFADVDHVEMQSDDSLFADGVHLIDSPGLEEDVSRTTTTNKFVPQADAIIFMLNAISLFSEKERSYIAENFEGKCRRNLFFVVNRINQVSDPKLVETDVKPNVRKNLYDVFVDENGVFDEDLYNKRVFFVDAYCAYCARTGTPTTVMVGRKEITVESDINDSGVPEFEDALREFLNSNDRICASFESIMTVMADAYHKAQKQVELDKATRSQSKAQREANAKEAEKKLKAAEANLESIQKTTRWTGEQVADKVYVDLLQYVQSDIPNNFAAYIEANNGLKDSFGAFDAVKMAGIRALAILPIESLREKMERKYENLLQPMISTVNGYIKDQLKEWEKRVPTLTASILEDFQEELDTQFDDFAINMENAKNTFAYGNATVAKGHGGVKQGVQTLLALSNLDISLAVNVNQGGDASWLDFAKGAGLQFGLDFVTGLIFGPGYWPFALAIEAIMIATGSKKAAGVQATAVGKEAFGNMSVKIKNAEMAIKSSIQNQLDDEVAPLVQTAQGTVNDTRNHMKNILSENAKSQAETDAANRKADESLSSMRGTIDTVFETLNGHKPSEVEFARLGKNEKAAQPV